MAAKLTQAHERHWIHEPVVGHDIDRCKMWYDGEGVSASLVKMSPGTRLSRHRHDTGVQGFLMSGTLTYEGASEKRTLGGRDYHFVPRGEAHIETAVDECTVLVIKAEPNIQYQIDDAGNRRT